jgi:hypothetical protein
VSSPGLLKVMVASLEPSPNVVMVVAPAGPPRKANGVSRSIVMNILDNRVKFLLFFTGIPP